MVYAAPWMPTITLDNIFEPVVGDRPERFQSSHFSSVSDVIVINRGRRSQPIIIDSLLDFRNFRVYIQQRMNMLEHNSVRAYQNQFIKET